MQTLHFKPYSKEKLIEDLREKFPARKIQTSLGSLQVRTSGFTITGNVQLKLNPQKGTVTTRTNLDMLIVFLVLFLPIGIYILVKKDKIKALESEVITGLKEILPPVG